MLSCFYSAVNQFIIWMAFTIVFYLMLCADFLPILFLVLKKKVLNNWQISFYLILSFLTQFFSHLLVIIGSTNLTLISFNIFRSALLIFIFLFQKVNQNKTLILFNIFFLVIVFSLYISIKFPFNNLALIVYIYLFVNILFSVIYYLKSTIKIDQIEFGFIISLLFYFSGAVSVIYILPLIPQTSKSIWILHNVVEIISKLIISFSIWKIPTNDFFKSEPPKV